MRRLICAMKNDVRIHLRSQLYTIGIALGLLVAIVIARMFKPQDLMALAPALVVFLAGGTTMLYAAAMLIFEKDEGTLNALLVSPLKTSEYLLSKVITLTLLELVEALIMIGAAMAMMSLSMRVSMPRLIPFFGGIVAIGVIHTLLSLALVLRYKNITDFFIPILLYSMLVLPLPMLYLSGVLEHWLVLFVPMTAPIMLLKGAYGALSLWQWLYAYAYTALLVVVLYGLTYYRFEKHIVLKGGVRA